MRFVCWLLLSALLGVSGCGFSATVRTPGVLEQALEQNPLTLDPALWSDVASGRLISLVCSPLVRIDENLQVVGDLAVRWEIDPSGKVYTFHIHPKARFTNGRAVTAEDVRYSFERVMDPKSKALRRWVFEAILGAKERAKGEAPNIKGLSVVDPSTLRVELTEPFAPFLQMLAMPVAGVVPKEEVERPGANFDKKPTGCGPYSVVEWLNDAYVELKANSAYHLGAPGLAGMRFRIIKEPVTRSSEFQLGNLDVIAVPAAELSFYANHAVWKDRIIRRPGLNVYYIGLNCEKGPTSDVRVRRAIAMAIDRTGILKSVRKGLAAGAHGPIPPGLAGYDESYGGIPFDPEQARKLLAEAGYAQGLDLELAQGDTKDNLEVTQIVASYLSRVGIRLKIAPFEWQTFKSRVNEGLTQAYYLSWWADYPEAENFLYPLYHSSQAGPAGNGPRYKNPKADELLERVRRTVDMPARVALYRQIERLVVEDASRVLLFHKFDIIVTQPWTKGIELFPLFNSNRYLGVTLERGI